MEPSQALVQIENSLRSVVQEIMPNWADSMPPQRVSKISTACDREKLSRDGVYASDDLIDFTYTGQVMDLVLDNWGQFADVFGDEARTRGFFVFVANVRNATAHSRDLLTFERDLLSGIAGQVRNQVGMWRTRTDSKTRHYPLIEKIVDGFGRLGRRDEHNTLYLPQIVRVEVGDVIQFHGLAHAARGFIVHWGMENYNSTPSIPEQVATGTDVEFEYLITTDDVGENRVLAITIWSESKYHRHHSYDDKRFFRLHVSPPEHE